MAVCFYLLWFSTLCKVSQETPLDIVNMSLKQWYQFLLEDNVTMREVGNSMEYIPCRVELLHPTTNWEVTWRRSRLSGLGSELASFLFRLLHDLLPTRERQGRIYQATANTCRLCLSNSGIWNGYCPNFADHGWHPDTRKAAETGDNY